MRQQAMDAGGHGYEPQSAHSMPIPRKLWEHPDPKSTAMWKFMQNANAKHGLKMEASDLPLYFEVYKYSASI